MNDLTGQDDENRASTWTDMYGIIHILKYQEEKNMNEYYDAERENMKALNRFNAAQKRRDRDLTGQDDEDFNEDSV